MLLINTLEREFLFADKGADIKLADPSGNFTPEAVLNFYAQTYRYLQQRK